jgi:uncharacterized protein DUF2760
MTVPSQRTIVFITFSIAILALNALALSTSGGGVNLYSSIASLIIALALLGGLSLYRTKASEPKQPKVESAKPIPIPAADKEAGTEIVSFLAILQERGRFVDFLMDDVTPYDDAEVGAAARVVHQGCKAVLQEHFEIRPIREESEGSPVTVAAGFAGDEYRLIGKISGPTPFSGTLVHRGWKAESVRLPRTVRVRPDDLPIIAPAEIELK